MERENNSLPWKYPLSIFLFDKTIARNCQPIGARLNFPQSEMAAAVRQNSWESAGA
jgi:hypothetical protein